MPLSILESSLDGMLLVETASEILEEAEYADFSFVDSLLLDGKELKFEDEEESPYV